MNRNTEAEGERGRRQRGSRQNEESEGEGDKERGRQSEKESKGEEDTERGSGRKRSLITAYTTQLNQMQTLVYPFACVCPQEMRDSPICSRPH